jgi:hypothetical protein
MTEDNLLDYTENVGMMKKRVGGEQSTAKERWTTSVLLLRCCLEKESHEGHDVDFTEG